MPYALEPMVAGETTADLIESFPVFLVSVDLADRLAAAGPAGFRLEDAEVIPSREYAESYGDAPHKAYRRLRIESGVVRADAWLDADFVLCVSDRMWDVLRQADLRGCDVEPLQSRRAARPQRSLGADRRSSPDSWQPCSFPPASVHKTPRHRMEQACAGCRASAG